MLPWPGGKARHASLIAGKIKQYDPSLYYEGFAGAANVAVALGCMAPWIKIVLTETHPKMVAALEYLKRTRPGKAVERITQEMKYLLKQPPLEQAALLNYARDEGDPIEWIAALQCRYPGELNSWNWNPDVDRFFSRMRSVAKGCRRYHLGLKNAIILCEPAAVRKDADVCFFDPPYYQSKKGMYPHAEGDTFQYAALFRRQRDHSRAIIISDFKKANLFYTGWSSQALGSLSAFRSDADDTLFTWAKGSVHPKEHCEAECEFPV